VNFVRIVAAIRRRRTDPFNLLFRRAALALKRLRPPSAPAVDSAALALGTSRTLSYNLQMRGNDKILEHLATALKAELTAISQYFLAAKINANWGFFRLAQHYRKESIEEMVHAEKLMDRILFLEGLPNMSDLGQIRVGKDVKTQLENDLALEIEAVHHLNTAIKDARDVGDNASRVLFEEILVDEEEHVDYLEGQLHAISKMGIEHYLAQNLHKGEDDGKD